MEQQLQPIPPNSLFQIVCEEVLRFLSETGRQGATIEKLAKAIHPRLPKGFFQNPKEVAYYLKGIYRTLETSGEVERVPLKPFRLRQLSHGREQFVEAARLGYQSIIKRMVGEGQPPEALNAALITSVINNHRPVVELLIKSGADVTAKENLFGKTALMFVTRFTDPQIEVLLREALGNQNGFQE